MDWWHKLEEIWFGTIPAKWHMQSTWIGHGLITALCVLVASIFQAPEFGYIFGVGGYAFKEGNEIFEKGWGNKIDHLGDFLGPVVIGGLFLLLTQLWC
ncbi:MAG: hypothetical protein KOO63_03955 [Bacteroidales bacterium]|nr:hypothetical protein [Candidatus Latescibacterota bacterium]